MNRVLLLRAGSRVKARPILIGKTYLPQVASDLRLY